MRAFLLGAGGQIGRHLLPLLSQFSEVTPAPAELDITAAARLCDALAAANPDVVVNAAAWTDVDAAEADPAAAHAANAGAVAELARWSADRGKAVVHFSTDFVFDGRKGAPYVEADEPCPVNVYGRSKLEGERALLRSPAPAVILRTSWVWSLASRSFVSTMLRLARERDVLRVIADQIGCPTHCREVAAATASMLRSMGPDVVSELQRIRGVYHVAGAGSCSRYELACAAIELDPNKHEHVTRCIEPVDAAHFPTPAQRPAQTALDCSRFRRQFGIALPHWRDTLRQVLERGRD